MTGRDLAKLSGSAVRDYGSAGALGALACAAVWYVAQQQAAGQHVTVRAPAEPVEVRLPSEPPAWLVSIVGQPGGMSEAHRMRFDELERRIDIQTRAIERMIDQLDPLVRRVELIEREVQGLRGAAIGGHP